MNTSSQTLQSQGSPILLLAQLLTTHPDLPAVTYHVDSIIPEQLDISVHHGRLDQFEVWRVALGLADPEERGGRGLTWVTTKGTVQDVSVVLTGHGSAAEVTAYTEAWASRPAVAA